MIWCKPRSRLIYWRAWGQAHTVSPVWRSSASPLRVHKSSGTRSPHHRILLLQYPSGLRGPRNVCPLAGAVEDWRELSYTSVYVLA
jgi:hypothetical protein